MLRKLNVKIPVIHVVGKMNLGGTEKMVTEIIKNIDLEKFPTSVVVHSNEVGDYQSLLKNYLIPIYHAPRLNGLNYFSYLRYWNDFFSQLSTPTIIHCHVRGPASIILRTAKKYGHITLSHSHGMSNGTGLSGLVKSLLQKNISNYADYRLACSNESGKWLFGEGFLNDKNRDFIWLNAFDYGEYIFDVEKRNKVRERMNVTDKFVVGTIGRLTWEKNHSFLLEVFSSLSNEQKEQIVLIIIGEGPERDSLEIKVNELKLNDVVFLNGSSDQVQSYLSSFDLFVLPSLKEGLGISALEAQVNGLKVLASDNVPKAVAISSSIEFLSLEERKWIEKIQKISRKEVYNSRDEENLDTKYDIKEYIEDVEAMYCNFKELEE